MQIVLNAPFADKENDLSNVIFKPHLELLREKIFFVIADQSELIKVTKQPNTILINGMSFASNDPKAIDQNGNRLDIGIAYNNDKSRPSDNIIEFVHKQFAEFGRYNIGINPPFIHNVIGASDCPTLTIALRRNLYLDESNRTMNPPAYKWNILINHIYQGIARLKSI